MLVPPGDERRARRRGRRRCSPTRSAASRWAAPPRALAAERYSWDDIARRLEEIYERAAA